MRDSDKSKTLVALGVAMLCVVLAMGAGWTAGFGHSLMLGSLLIVVLAIATLYSAIGQVRQQAATTRAILERAADGIVTANDSGEILLVNAAAQEMFGYRAAELSGLDFSVLLTSAYGEEGDGDLWDFLRSNAIQASGRAHEVVGLRKNGDKFFADLSISHTEVNGAPTFVVIFRDVTERKKADIALRKARDELEIRVEERTTELKVANASLTEEIAERKRSEERREKLLTELQQAMADVKILSGLIPICASCKKVRDDDGFWSQIEVYLQDRSEAQFSHGICPECTHKLYPDMRSEVE